MSREYRNINHPAVAAVKCPFCYQPRGVPCIRKNRRDSGRWFVETHIARARLHQPKEDMREK